MIKTYVYLSSTGLGLLVLLDIVHSYSAADEMIGLSHFDGTNDCYFHAGNLIFDDMVFQVDMYSNLLLPISLASLHCQ